MGNDNDKDQTIKKDVGHSSISGRPNIDEISKRNEIEEKRERKSTYIKTGIIILMVVVVVLLVYFFS